MYIQFDQGVITCPSNFLKRMNNGIGIDTNAQHIMGVISTGDQYVLMLEPISNQVLIAWTDITDAALSYWLFWDINIATGQRTYVSTNIEPIKAYQAPQAPIVGQMWFDTNARVYKEWNGSAWVRKLRLQAGIVRPGFAITQTAVGPYLDNPRVVDAGFILFDRELKAIRQGSKFVTTNDPLITDVSTIHGFKLDQGVTFVQAGENLSKFTVVKLDTHGAAVAADPSDLADGIVGITTNDAMSGEAVNLALDGLLSNPEWMFNVTELSRYVYMTAGGQLIFPDAYRGEEHVAIIGRVYSSNTIKLDFRLGAAGTIVIDNTQSATVGFATTTTYGKVKLSVDSPTSTVVADDDPRMSDARVPLDHQHASSDVLVGTVDIKSYVDTAVSAVADAISNEIGRASQTEQDIQQRLTTESQTRTSQNETLSAAIDSEVAARESLSNAVSGLSQTIQQEVTRASQAEASLTQSVIAERDRAQQVEQALNAKINDEITRAQQAEGSATQLVQQEANRASQAENALSLAIQGEINRATQAENTTYQTLQDEIVRATSADNTLNDQLQQEIQRATTAEGQLTTQVAQETQRATLAETSIAQSVVAERNRAEQIEASLTQQLNSKFDKQGGDVSGGITITDIDYTAVDAGDVVTKRDLDTALTSIATPTEVQPTSIDFTLTRFVGEIHTWDQASQPSGNLFDFYNDYKLVNDVAVSSYTGDASIHTSARNAALVARYAIKNPTFASLEVIPMGITIDVWKLETPAYPQYEYAVMYTIVHYDSYELEQARKVTETYYLPCVRKVQVSATEFYYSIAGEDQLAASYRYIQQKVGGYSSLSTHTYTVTRSDSTLALVPYRNGAQMVNGLSLADMQPGLISTLYPRATKPAQMLDLYTFVDPLPFNVFLDQCRAPDYSELATAQIHQWYQSNGGTSTFKMWWPNSDVGTLYDDVGERILTTGTNSVSLSAPLSGANAFGVGSVNTNGYGPTWWMSKSLFTQFVHDDSFIYGIWSSFPDPTYATVHTITADDQFTIAARVGYRAESDFANPAQSYRLFTFGSYQKANSLRVDYDDATTSLLLSIGTWTDTVVVPRSLFQFDWSYHIAIQLRNGAFEVFVNGQLIGTTSSVVGVDIIDPYMLALGTDGAVWTSDARDGTSATGVVFGDVVLAKVAFFNGAFNANALPMPATTSALMPSTMSVHTTVNGSNVTQAVKIGAHVVTSYAWNGYTFNASHVVMDTAAGTEFYINRNVFGKSYATLHEGITSGRSSALEAPKELIALADDSNWFGWSGYKLNVALNHFTTEEPPYSTNWDPVNVTVSTTSITFASDMEVPYFNINAPATLGGLLGMSGEWLQTAYDPRDGMSNYNNPSTPTATAGVGIVKAWVHIPQSMPLIGRTAYAGTIPTSSNGDNESRACLAAGEMMSVGKLLSPATVSSKYAQYFNRVGTVLLQETIQDAAQVALNTINPNEVIRRYVWADGTTSFFSYTPGSTDNWYWVKGDSTHLGQRYRYLSPVIDGSGASSTLQLNVGTTSNMTKIQVTCYFDLQSFGSDAALDATGYVTKLVSNDTTDLVQIRRYHNGTGYVVSVTANGSTTTYTTGANEPLFSQTISVNVSGINSLSIVSVGCKGGHGQGFGRFVTWHRESVGSTLPVDERPIGHFALVATPNDAGYSTLVGIGTMTRGGAYLLDVPQLWGMVGNLQLSVVDGHPQPSIWGSSMSWWYTPEIEQALMAWVGWSNTSRDSHPPASTTALFTTGTGQASQIQSLLAQLSQTMYHVWAPGTKFRVVNLTGTYDEVAGIQFNLPYVAAPILLTSDNGGYAEWNGNGTSPVWRSSWTSLADPN